MEQVGVYTTGSCGICKGDPQSSSGRLGGCFGKSVTRGSSRTPSAVYGSISGRPPTETADSDSASYDPAFVAAMDVVFARSMTVTIALTAEKVDSKKA